MNSNKRRKRNQQLRSTVKRQLKVHHDSCVEGPTGIHEAQQDKCCPIDFAPSSLSLAVNSSSSEPSDTSNYISSSELEISEAGSSDDEHSAINDDTPQSDIGSSNFVFEFRNWTLQSQIPDTKIKTLMELLNKYGATLPKDPRTLKRTPISSNVEVLPPGEYLNFQWEDKVKKFVSHHRLLSVKLLLNADGIPIYNRSPIGFWPILARIQCQNLHHIKLDPFLVGLYCGISKPDNSNDFLRPFKNQFVELKDQMPQLTFKTSLICDLPARSYMLGITGHAGYGSCSKCTIRGRNIQKRVAFPPESGVRDRIDADFRTRKDKNFHNVTEPLALEDVLDDMITDVPCEYMHLVCLGVTRKLLYLLTKTKKSTARLRPYKVQALSNALTSMRPFIPREFSRKPRPLKDIDHFKATEFRQFLLYTGPVVLKRILDLDRYKHFLKFHVAVTILANREICQTHNTFADQLLQSFVSEFGKWYDRKHCSHNVHSLLHLASDVKHHGTLDDFSAFPFENHLQKVKRLIRAPNKPIVQIFRRLGELEKLEMDSHERVEVSEPHIATESGPLHVSSATGNNCVLLKNGKYAKIKAVSSGEVTVKTVKKSSSLYTTPCDSAALGVQVVLEWNPPIVISSNDIQRKCILLPHESNFVIFPLLN